MCVNTTNFADAESVHTDQQMLQAFLNSFKKMLNCKIMRRKLSYSSTSQLSKWLSIDKEKVERSRRRAKEKTFNCRPPPSSHTQQLFKQFLPRSRQPSRESLTVPTNSESGKIVTTRAVENKNIE